MAEIDVIADKCGYANYSNTYVTYPPKGPLPLPGKSVYGDHGCNVWEPIFQAALLVNPAFDIYRVFDTVRTSTLYSVSTVTHSVVPSIRSCGTYLVSRANILNLYLCTH